MVEPINIQTMSPSDWASVSQIYREGIETGVATFEKEVPTWEDWNINHLDACRWVARMGEDLIGWAALSPVSSRCVYGGVAEVSLYVTQRMRGNGVGEQLLAQLITSSEAEGYWTLQSGIFPENIGSLRLHNKLGFRKIGYRERIGQLDGVWKDNILMERRSSKTGL